MKDLIFVLRFFILWTFSLFFFTQGTTIASFPLQVSLAFIVTIILVWQ